MLNTTEIRKNRIIWMLKCLLLSRERGQVGRDHPSLSTRGLMVGDVKDQTCSMTRALLSTSAPAEARAKEEIWTWAVNKSCPLELQSANLET